MHTCTQCGIGNIVLQRWWVVTGGLSDAAAQQGPLGLSMQLCGGTDRHWLSKGFGQAPRVVSWMVAPSLRSPNVHRWLQWSGAMSKSSTQFFAPNWEKKSLLSFFSLKRKAVLGSQSCRFTLRCLLFISAALKVTTNTCQHYGRWLLLICNKALVQKHH